MARHFLQLYVLIVLTLAAASWGQNELWETFSARIGRGVSSESAAQAAALSLVDSQLHEVPQSERRAFVKTLARSANINVELFNPADIAGDDTLARLARGELAYMRAADEDWLLRRVTDEDRILVLRYPSPNAQRGLLDWALAFAFYAAIALVIMIWLWPLTRDLKQLERSTTRFGDRNWVFDTRIDARSPIYTLAEAFRRMVARIDGLIGSQKDLSNAMSHEIKTPLARMRFEIEMARTAESPGRLTEHLNNINADIGELDNFVTATLDYAILDRAEVALNIARHDFTLVLPAVVESIARTSRTDLEIRCEVSANATAVACDAHLIETVLRNLIYNAIRHARSQVRVTFFVQPDGLYNLRVDDDGPGIPDADRERVFGSFVQLDNPTARKTGYGLGLAIVRRIVEWHGGKVTVSRSGLGGAGFSVIWPPTAV